MFRGWMNAPSKSGVGLLFSASFRFISSASFRLSRFTVRKAARSWSGGIWPRSGRSSGILLARNCSLTSMVSIGNRRGRMSTARARETALPASSWAVAVTGALGARFHGSA